MVAILNFSQIEEIENFSQNFLTTLLTTQSESPRHVYVHFRSSPYPANISPISAIENFV